MHAVKDIWTLYTIQGLRVETAEVRCSRGCNVHVFLITDEYDARRIKAQQLL